MSKKFLIWAFFGILLILAGGGGFFWWWQEQSDVRELNKNLPEGVRVVKSLAGEYRVVNKIDGYEFKVPEEWGGLKEVEYKGEWLEKGYKGKNVEIEGKEGEGRIIQITQSKIDNPNIDLQSWAKDVFETFGLSTDFSKEKIGKFEILKSDRVSELLFNPYFYFLKTNSTIYTITGFSEEPIKYLISNGKW